MYATLTTTHTQYTYTRDEQRELWADLDYLSTHNYAYEVVFHA